MAVTVDAEEVLTPVVIIIIGFRRTRSTSVILLLSTAVTEDAISVMVSTARILTLTRSVALRRTTLKLASLLVMRSMMARKHRLRRADAVDRVILSLAFSLIRSYVTCS